LGAHLRESRDDRRAIVFRIVEFSKSEFFKFPKIQNQNSIDDKITQTEKRNFSKTRVDRSGLAKLCRRLRGRPVDAGLRVGGRRVCRSLPCLLYGYPSQCILLYEEIDLAVQLVGRTSVPTRSISH
jgi:hypothetical protein